MHEIPSLDFEASKVALQDVSIVIHSIQTSTSLHSHEIHDLNQLVAMQEISEADNFSKLLEHCADERLSVCKLILLCDETGPDERYVMCGVSVSICSFSVVQL